MTEYNAAEHRRHVRCTVYEPCVVLVGDEEF